MEDSTPIPLDKFQEWMQHLLLDPFQKTDTNPYDFLPSALNASSPEAVVNHSERLPAHEHLAIYQRSYIARLRSCMAQQFSALEYALGEELFRAFADDYLALHPSPHYNLSALGAHFAKHLEANRPDAEEAVKEDWIDFMIELAKFEYDINILFEQKAEEDYQLAGMNDPEEKMELLPLFALFKFRFPTRTFYTEFKKGTNPGLPFESESYCVVLRHQFKLFIYDLHAEQFDFLTGLKNRMDISLAKADFVRRNKAAADAFEQTWPAWKQRWIEAKFFSVKTVAGK